MVLPRPIFGLAMFVTLAAAIPAALESRQPVPSGWTLHRRADSAAVLPLKFSLVQSNLHNLEAYLLDIADPDSSNYGKHWSPTQVAEIFRPSQESVDAVRSWLIDEKGIDPHSIQLSRNRDAFHVNVTISAAEDILGTEYYIYSYDGDGSERVGCHEGYTLPQHVSKHVDIIWPTNHFFSPSLWRRDPSGTVLTELPHMERESGASFTPVEASQLAAENCDQAVTIDCLRALYNFNPELVSTDKNSIGVGEFGANIFRPSDLDMFFGMYAPDQVGHRPTLVSVEGGNLSSGSLGESTLDFDLVMGLLDAKQEITLYQVGETNSAQNPVDELLAALDGSFCSVEGVSEEGLTDCGDKPRTNVISMSYHFSPDLRDPTILPVITRYCTEFGKLSLTGITFVASSGDSGVSYGTGQHGCVVANGTLVNGNPVGSFVGQLPASCPFVTAVGGTSVSPGNSVDDPETATTDFPSGGGFSNAFARPSFQEAVVANYIEKFAPSYALDIYNRSGRAYPDVSANGFPTVVAVNGRFALTGGTSASAPIFASIITAVNDARIAAGKGPVGWINPALYSSGFQGVFNDVTNGTNPGCQTEGFVAAPGWDPVTGLGTPNFPRLVDAFLSLP